MPWKLNRRCDRIFRDLSISDTDYTKRIQRIMLICWLKTLSRDSSNLVSRRRSNVNSFDKVSSSSLLPRRTKKKSNHSAEPSVVSPNLHLYRLHAINENIKSIFVRGKERRRGRERKTRPRDTRRHVQDALLRPSEKINRARRRDVSRSERVAFVSRKCRGNFAKPHLREKVLLN